MPIPELLRPSDHSYYTMSPLPPGGWPDRESARSLRKSLDKAHDNLRRVVRENDHLRRALLELHKRQLWQRRIFIVLMGATWTVLGGIIKFLLPYALHGMNLAH